MRLLTLCIGCVMLVVAPSALRAQAPAVTPSAGGSPASPKPDVVFDHLDGKSKIFDRDFNDGQKFVVRITNTCPDAFDYPYVGVERGDQLQSEKGLKALSNKDIEVVYDQRFGGYVFSIVQKADPATICTNGEKLKPTSFIVGVRLEWNLSFGGGFTVSGLTNPVYRIQKDKEGVKTIVPDSEKEDSRKLGAPSFVHVFHDAVQWKQLAPALAFGLGIGNDNHTEYMVGAGLRLGDQATINAGRAWGSIARLPTGVSLNTTITDDNTLNNLGTQAARGIILRESWYALYCYH